MKKFLFSLLLTALAAVFVMCSDDDNGNKTYKVQYKVTSSENAEISVLTYTNEEGDNTVNTAISGTSWTSDELTIPSSVMIIGFGASGNTTDESSDGTLTVQIIVNGEVVKENVSTGNVLSATTTYSF